MIPFNKPYMTGKELEFIKRAHAAGHLSGDGQYTKLCNRWLEERIRCAKALLTHSCTAALELAAILLDVGPGDEIIMPSYTFVSTANAFALRGATPVFVDIRPDTLNIDEGLIESAITDRTRAICVVHYAGVACEMDTIMEIARRRNLAVVEDAAHAIMSTYRGRSLGAIGDLGALSFHETKNIISGEGGALLCRDNTYVDRAEVVREKGTNRSQFFRGQFDKYSWVDIGSSFLPGEISAAFLYAQMGEADEITARRMAIWKHYHAELAGYELAGLLRRPVVPPHCRHNAHMYYVLFNSMRERTAVIERMRVNDVHPVFHYIPLHNSPAGRKYGRSSGELAVTDRVSDTLLRLPLWLPDLDVNRVIEVLGEAINAS